MQARIDKKEESENKVKHHYVNTLYHRPRGIVVDNQLLIRDVRLCSAVLFTFKSGLLHVKSQAITV